MSLLDKLTPDDLDADQRELAECIGLEAYIKLLKNIKKCYTQEDK